MKFPIKKLVTFVGGTVIAGSFSQVHAGAYLYCVNKNIIGGPEKALSAPCGADVPPTDYKMMEPPSTRVEAPAPPTECKATNSPAWQWARWGDSTHKPPVPAPTWLVTDIAGEQGKYNNVWLYGQLADLQLSHGYQNLGIDTTGYVPYYDPDPIEFCAKLVKLCTDEFGADYRFIGAGAGAVAGWNGVSLYKTNDPTHTLYTCPNWRPGAFIEESSFSPNQEYKVSCYPPGETTTTFGIDTERSNQRKIIWTNGTVSYETPNVFPNQGLLDNHVGLFYCTGQPGE